MVRVLTLAVTALATVYLVAAALVDMRGVPIPERLFQLVALWYLVPGAIVVLRRSGHVIGWLLVGSGLLWAIQLSSEVAGGGLAWVPEAWLAWLTYWIGNAQWALTVALFVLFPDGFTDRPPLQRRADRVMVATPVLATIAGMLAADVGSGSVHGPHQNPTGLGLLPTALTDYLIVPVGVVGLASVIRLWYRARTVTGVGRRQYSWVLFSFGVVMVGLVFGLVFGGILGEDAAWIPIVVGWFLIPSAFSVAILRYRLYEIDRVISRTVAYALITAIVSAIYAVPVVTLPELFGLGGPLPVATATLLASAAFAPVRRQVQRQVDRRFHRAQVDARRELEDFSVRLRSQVNLDTLVTEINGLVVRNLEPSIAVTWLRPDPKPAFQRRSMT